VRALPRPAPGGYYLSDVAHCEIAKTGRYRAPYDLWTRQGFIEAIPGNIVN
jgi:hypothetical protein